MLDAFRTLTFIAEEAAPVLLTSALPGDDTCPMQAAGERQTLVTELALPAVAATEKHIRVLTHKGLNHHDILMTDRNKHTAARRCADT